MASNSKKGLGLTQSNKNTHIFTEFEQMNKETTQLQVLDAVKTLDITGSTLGQTTEGIDTKISTIINKKGDIEASIYYADGAQVWADSAPTPIVNPLDPNGWLYTNTNAGNAMNLYYFNGVNEIKTLSQVTGQYAVVTNGSTLLNDSMIFAVYTKSNTSFFTSRITHSPVSGVDMVAGGKYLIYWGDVSSDIYPSLPRLEFTNVGITGPAIPTEEILTVGLNTNSSNSAGSIEIFIEALGVVFDTGSRVYQLFGSPTEYEALRAIKINTDKNLYDEDGNLKVNVVVGGGGGGGGGIIQGENESSGLGVNINAEVNALTGINRLYTHSNLYGNFIDGLNTTEKALTLDTDGNLKVNVVVGGGGGGGSSVVQGVSTTSPYPDVNISAEANTLPGGASLNRLYTHSSLYGYDGVTETEKKVAVNTEGEVSVQVKNTSIDTHCYGSSDGSAFQLLKTTGTGNLITESKTHDGSNNPITSTVVSTKRGLDVNVIAGGGGGGGVVQLQAYNVTDGTTAVNVFAENNRLLVSGSTIVGTVGNIHTGTLTASTFSTALNIDNQFGNESVISYVDTSSTQTTTISIYGSFNNVTYFYIGVLQPVNIRSTLRNASAVLKLRGLKYIKIYNEGLANTLGISCTLFSG